MQKESAFDKVLLHVITILWVAAGISGVWLTAGLSALLWRCVAVGGKWEDRFTNVRALPLIFLRNLQETVDDKAAQVLFVCQEMMRSVHTKNWSSAVCWQSVALIFRGYVILMNRMLHFFYSCPACYFFLSKCHNSFDCEKLICRS